jgi:hypothetical protein
MESGREGVESRLDRKGVKALFERWRRAWSFSISNQLKTVQQRGFSGYSLRRVNALVRAWSEHATSASAPGVAGEHGEPSESHFAEALFSTWVWVSGARPAELRDEPAFLKNAHLREAHLEGWRMVLETRAWAVDTVPPYVLRHASLHDAWRRGWCARLSGEAVGVAGLPDALRADEALRSAWISGWETQLFESPLSAWEIPVEIRDEERIRTAWCKGWVDRFQSGENSRDMAVLVRHVFSPDGLPVHRRLWVVAVAGGGEADAVGVPPGYEAAEAEVESNARAWADAYLKRGAWDAGSRAGLEMTPALFVFLCSKNRQVPQWEELAPHLRRDARVQQAWMRRYGLEKRWIYALENMAAATEASPTGHRNAALEALFDRPWAEEELTPAARSWERVKQAVREGWAEKLRGGETYRELHQALHSAKIRGADRKGETPAEE